MKYLQVRPILTHECWALQMTPVSPKDGEVLPELDINYRTVGSLPGSVVFLEMVRMDALPGCHYQHHPGWMGLLEALQSGCDGWDH